MTLAHIRCFLSRPFGHRWKYVSEYGDEYLRCTACGKRARSGSYRPGHPSPWSAGGGD